MLKHVRVDDRLIHGQVATVWVNQLGCDRIIVANDEVVKNEMQISALKVACPAGVKLSILSLAKASTNIKEGKYDADAVFLICRTIADCKILVDGGVPVKAINVGNLPHKDGQKKIKNSVSLSEQDIADIKKLIDRGIPITAQMVPNDSPAGILTYL